MLGGLVVLFKLNPYLVALHFVLTIVILANAVVLYHLSGSHATRAQPVVGRDLVRLARLQLRPSRAHDHRHCCHGPDPMRGAPEPSGSRSRSGTSPRLTPPRLFLIGLTLASQFAFHQAKAPQIVLRRGRLFLEVMVSKERSDICSISCTTPPGSWSSTWQG